MRRGRVVLVASVGAVALYAATRADPSPPSDLDTARVDQPAFSAEPPEQPDEIEALGQLPGRLPTLESPLVEPQEPAHYSAAYEEPSDLLEFAKRAPEFDEDRARYDARREAAKRGYRGFCTSDCSGHEAGYQWAHDNRLSRPGYTDNSPSFDEGQEAYVRDVKRRVEDKRAEFENDPEQSEYGY